MMNIYALLPQFYPCCVVIMLLYLYESSQFRFSVTDRDAEVTHSSGGVMLPQEKICHCPPFVTELVCKTCRCFSVHPSLLMRHRQETAAPVSSAQHGGEKA